MDDRMDCDSVLGDKSPELSYETEQEKAFCFSKAFETTGNTRPHITTLNMFSMRIKTTGFLVSRLHKVITIMSSTFSSPTVRTLPLNRTYGAVISTRFLFTVLSSK